MNYTVKRSDDKIIIEIPDKDKSIDISSLQSFMDYVNIKTLLSKSKATDEDISNLSEDIKKEWWDANRSRFIK